MPRRSLGEGGAVAQPPRVRVKNSPRRPTLAASAIGNSARKRAAQRNAQVTWREHQHVSVIVTNHRFLCHTRVRGWLSFYFSGVSEFYPDLHGWNVTLVFENGDPLQLSGPSTPALSLWSAIGILGPRWADDPRLAPLLG